VQAELDRAYARLPQRAAAPNALVRVDELAARRVREDAVARSPEEPPERLAAGAADKVPDGELDDPVAAVMEVDRLDDAMNDLGVLDLPPDEEALEELAVGDAVAARVPLAALVRAHDRDGRVLVGARDGVPRGRERWIERVAVAPRLDRRDLHSPE
jgi:hypothetical protein